MRNRGKIFETADKDALGYLVSIKGVCDCYRDKRTDLCRDDCPYMRNVGNSKHIFKKCFFSPCPHEWTNDLNQYNRDVKANR